MSKSTLFMLLTVLLYVAGFACWAALLFVPFCYFSVLLIGGWLLLVGGATAEGFAANAQ